MNHYTVEILKSDFTYVIEAIRMRGHALADQIAAQAVRAEQVAMKPEDPRPWTVTVTDEGNTVATYKPKKRGRPARKSADAPYGYKKDGTPKQRPGRKVPA